MPMNTIHKWVKWAVTLWGTEKVTRIWGMEYAGALVEGCINTGSALQTHRSYECQYNSSGLTHSSIAF